MPKRGSISIWFFIGGLLAVYGVLILAAGIYQVWRPPQPPLVLQNLHAGVWWGALLLAAGLFYLRAFRPR
ncbi:MAG TPA: hypothetical protein VMV31_07390 [Terriglobales bacterium]|nr:hypothetical protein [Terriglobales bacterium]